MRPFIRTVLNDLFVSLDQGTSRSVVRSILYLVPVAAIALYSHRDLYTGTQIPSGTAHPEQSVNVALNARYCGKPQGWSSKYSVQSFLTIRRDLMATPFRNVIAAMAGSVDEYCKWVNDPIVVSENSLMWLMRLALWYDVHLTPDRLGGFLGATRMLMLIVFGFALLRTGSSVLFTLSAVVVGAEVLRGLGVRDSIYPFVLTLPLLSAGLYGMAMTTPWVRRGHISLWIFALVMGMLMAFSASTRTVNLPVGILMFGVFVLVMFLRREGGQTLITSFVRLGGATASYAAGYMIYVAIFITPLLVFGNGVQSYVYHTFAHQLVLGLAVPESEFSKREGLEWADMKGYEYAKRMIPDVAYLGPTYETALFMFYRKLWREHPGDMVRVYIWKGRFTGDNVIPAAANVAKNYYVPMALGLALDKVVNGFVLVVLVAAAFVLALWRSLRNDGARALIVALLSLGALVSLVEAFFTYSPFVGIYYSDLEYYVLFASLVLIQFVVDRVARRIFAGPGVAVA